MTHLHRTCPPSFEAVRTARARAAFAVWRPGEQAERERAIRSLPTKLWKGRPVFQIRCHGTRGKGPHDVWVPEAMLWASIDPFRRWCCVYHAGDQLQEPARG
jgi:hypothetical protein